MITVIVLCGYEGKQVRADGISIKHADDTPCFSRKFVIREERIVDETEAHRELRRHKDAT